MGWQANEIEGRVAGLNVQGYANEFFLLEATATERLSEPYIITSRALGPAIDVALYDDILGKRASLWLDNANAAINTDESKGGRSFNGLITEISWLGMAAAPMAGGQTAAMYDVYDLVIRPGLSLMRQRRNCRIFQDKSIPEIIKEVLTESGIAIDDRLGKQGASSNYQKLLYCTQYNESDFDFISRLMEQEGIFYFFDCAKRGGSRDGIEKIVLCDGNSQSLKSETADIPFIAGISLEGDHTSFWRATQGASIATKKVSLKDFSSQKSRTSLLIETVATSPPQGDKAEAYQYPGSYSWDAAPDSQASKLENERPEGTRYAKIKLEALRAQRSRIFLEGRCFWLGAGQRFTLTEHPSSIMAGEQLVVEVSYRITPSARMSGNSKSPILSCTVMTVPLSVPFRPAMKTPRSMVFGPQTALVVGDTTDPNDIYTDKFGRVKVRFHWDRSSTADTDASCWVRVSQAWAGPQWGGMALPRIGQEVIIEFLDGDPDRPIITGRVYNAQSMPPYALPDDKWKFTIKSRSKSGEYNELRFDDTSDAEEIFVHAGKDMNTEVLNNQTLKVKKDRTVTVEEGNESYTVAQGNHSTLINQGNQDTKLDTGNQSTTISTGNQTTKINVGDLETTTSAGSMKFTAGMQIELIVGGSSIKIDNAGITIKAPMIQITGDATADMGSPMTTVKGDGILTLQGGLVKIN